MWGSTAASAYGPAGAVPAPSSNQPKHDIFVGNLNFNTTEEQLHQAFSEMGRVIRVRMVHDQETGRPKGFAFIEFEDPTVALSAIRNMNDYELNGRRLRVNFSNSSHLEALAGKMGMADMPQQQQQQSRGGTDASSSGGGGTQAVADALKSFSKSEMYDVVAKLKEIADKDPDEARRLLSGHPQLPEAMLHLMSKLDMIQTPVMTAPPPMIAPPPAAPPPRVADPRVAAAAAASRPADPRSAAAAAATTTTSAPPPPPVANAPPPALDPRQQAQQQRMAATDPRQQQQQQQQHQQYAMPPQQQAQPSVAAIDPSLVQQVMSLSEEQISQLPPDKQQSIRMLRQQVTGGM